LSAAGLPVDLPEVLAEVRAAFEAYEAALLRHDLAVLDAFFWHGAEVLRYGVAEHSLGIEGLRRYRAEAPPVDPRRQLHRTVIKTFGRDAASACTEFTSPATPLLGRQTQTWIRLAGGWKIVAAHVSMVDPAGPKLYY
jgi:hypothetical protein